MDVKLENLGWDDFFESKKVEMGLDNFSVARITTEYKGAYKVKNVDGEYVAKITGKQMFRAKSREDYPAVGDWVAISELNDMQAVIKEILPRKTVIKRRFGDKNKSGEKNDVQIIATNIDMAFIVESFDRDWSLNRLERYFTVARDGGVKPAIILNKIDLISPEELNVKLAQIKERFGDIDVIATSIKTDEGIDELEDYLEKGKTYCFLGSSGVGKSSLINKLLGEEAIKTGRISSYSERGRHTTTSREMYFLDSGAIVIDNPGLREVGMTDASRGIDETFDEIATLARNCKYVDCTHIHEPGCAVLSALKSGELDEDKYSNYTRVKKEAGYFEMNTVEKREKDRKFGKFMKKAKKVLNSSGHKDF